MCWTHGCPVPEAEGHGSLHTGATAHHGSADPAQGVARPRPRARSPDGRRGRTLGRGQLLRAAAPRRDRGESAHRCHGGGADRDRRPGRLRAGPDPAGSARGRHGAPKAGGGPVRAHGVLPAADRRCTHRPPADRRNGAHGAHLRRRPGRGAVRGDSRGSGRTRQDRRPRHVGSPAGRPGRAPGLRRTVGTRRVADCVLGERPAHGGHGGAPAPPSAPAAPLGRRRPDGLRRAVALHPLPAAHGAPVALAVRRRRPLHGLVQRAADRADLPADPAALQLERGRDRALRTRGRHRCGGHELRGPAERPRPCAGGLRGLGRPARPLLAAASQPASPRCCGSRSA